MAPNGTRASAGTVFSEGLPVMHPVLIDNDYAFWFHAGAGVTFRTLQGGDTMCLWIEMICEVFSHETVVRLIPPLPCCLHSSSGRWGHGQF